MSGSILTRRRFLQLAGTTSLAVALQRTGAALTPLLGRYDDGSSRVPGGVSGEPDRVIVVGAGFAGLAVANALRSAGVDCVVLEGRDRIGGRAWTADIGGSPVDLGCSWITEPVGNPMTRFCLQAGVLQTNAAIELDVPTSRFYDQRTGVVLPGDTLHAIAEMLRFGEIEAASISERLGPRASIKDGILAYLDAHRLTGDLRRRASYFMRLITELPDATDWDKDSLKYWAGYESPYIGVGQGNFPVGGYVQLVEALAGTTDVRLRHRVTHVAAEPDGVRVTATNAHGDPVTLTGSHAVVTIPLGVLKAGAIGFSPALPAAKAAAVDRLGFGTFEKVVMRFPSPYWATSHTNVFHLSHPRPMRFPLIVDYFHIEAIPVLVAFNTGSYARELDGRSDEEVARRMLAVLRRVHGRPIPDPTDVIVTRWGNDPFSNGSYSFIQVGSSHADQDALARPFAGRILFAGEATSRSRYGYADGAFTTGIREAKRLLRRPSVEIRAGR